MLPAAPPSPPSPCRRARRGFSLLEITIAMAISAPILAGIWQLTASVGQKSESTAIASQALSVSSAAKSYISAQSSTLLALPGLASLGSVVRVKITDTDTGVTANSVQGAGYLPQSFVNLNSFGQSYALFVRREDAGTMGVADTGDRVIGLLVTTGGATISDAMGAQIAKGMGAPGGFLYADSNPDAPSAATTAQGAYGGWQIDLSAAGWSSIGTVAKEGHLAALVNLLPSGSGGGGGGASEIDDLDDGATDYGNGNMFMGQDAGDAITSGTFNTGVGHSALKAVSSASNNTAFGAYALKAQTTGTGDNSAFGFNALVANLTGARNTAIGAYALQAGTASPYNTAVGAYSMYSMTSATGYNTALGYRALYTAASAYNTAIGALALETATGLNNTAVGSNALQQASGSNNTAIGYAAGNNITSGGNNIIIGSSVGAPSATAFNQLNIGNTIYGDLSTDAVNIGSSTIVSGIGFDVGTNTSASRLSVGTTAQRPTCTAALEGAQRWNRSTGALEMCNGSAWVSPVFDSGGGAPPVPPSGSGYFVLTETTWDGNLGGSAGAHSACYTELTTKTNWLGYATALANGQLTTMNVRAFLNSNNASPLTTYYFARVGEPSTGGASFTTNSSGEGFGYSTNFAGVNYFNGVVEYWTGRSSTATIWGSTTTSGGGCSSFSSNSASDTGTVGLSSATGTARVWSSGYCNVARYLICMVHP